VLFAAVQICSRCGADWGGFGADVVQIWCRSKRALLPLFLDEKGCFALRAVQIAPKSFLFGHGAGR
jgi:hypothetical protein